MMTKGYIEIDDIPGDCLDCPVVFVAHCTGQMYCRVAKKQIFEYKCTERPDWCPIKEHDLGECAERHKEEMEELLMQATKRLGW